MGDRDLEDALQSPAAVALGFMPELLKAVVTGVPLASVEQCHRGVEAGIRHQRQLFRISSRHVSVPENQRRAGFLAGSLRKRIESGVTSSISSGPMYSSARSRVI